jgi:hypothetical protein
MGEWEGQEWPGDRRVRAETRGQFRNESHPLARARGMSSGRAGVLLISLFGIAHTHAFGVAPPIGAGSSRLGTCLRARVCGIQTALMCSVAALTCVLNPEP